MTSKRKQRDERGEGDGNVPREAEHQAARLALQAAQGTVVVVMLPSAVRGAESQRGKGCVLLATFILFFLKEEHSQMTPSYFSFSSPRKFWLNSQSFPLIQHYLPEETKINA